jgi:hypothetical protein
MDVLKLIPQLFYDLISRVLPGSLAIVLIGGALNIQIGKLLADFWDGATAIQESALFLGICLLTAAYLLGQLMSPLSDFIEDNIVKRLFSASFNVLKSIVSTTSEYPESMRNVLIQEIGVEVSNTAKLTSRHFKNAIFLWYDWLRVNNSDAGARAAKIRAEYRMHSQNTVAFAAALVIHLIWSSTNQANVSVAFIAVMVIGCWISVWATARHYKIFQWAVINQFYAAKSVVPKAVVNKSTAN